MPERTDSRCSTCFSHSSVFGGKAPRACQTHLFPLHTLPPAGMAAIANAGASMNGNGDGAPINIGIQDPGVDLARKTVCIKVRLSTMGNTRKVSTAQIEADADKDLLRVSKQLVASE